MGVALAKRNGIDHSNTITVYTPTPTTAKRMRSMAIGEHGEQRVRWEVLGGGRWYDFEGHAQHPH